MIGNTSTMLYGGSLHQRIQDSQSTNQDGDPGDYFPSYDLQNDMMDNYEDEEVLNTVQNDIRILQNMGRPDGRDRKPFDKLWTLFFAATIIGLGCILMKSTVNGSSAILSHPLNYQGLACGHTKAVRHLPVLYYPINPKTAFSKQVQVMDNRAVCVKRCPTQPDVDGKGFIPISETSVVQDSSKSAYISVLHTVRSPLYASDSHDSHFCIPENPELRTTVLSAISKQLSSSKLRSIARGLFSILPSAILLSLASIMASFLLGAGVAKAQGLSAVCITVSIVTSITFGCKLLLTRSSPTGESIFVPGVACIAFGIGLAVWVAINWDSFVNACKVAQVTSLCMSEMPQMQGLIVILQLSAAVVGLMSIIGFILLQSCLEFTSTPLNTSLDPNGGLQLIPLERTLSNSFSLSFQSMCILLAAVWFFEGLLCTMKYMVAYTGIAYYFTPEPEYGNRSLPARIPLVAMRQAVMYTSGSLTCLACMRWLSRLIRLVFMTSAATRFDDGLLSNDVTPASRHPRVTGKSAAHRVCDLIHNGIFTELAITARPAFVAAKISEIRLKKGHHACAAALIGLTSLITWSTLTCIGVVVYVTSATLMMALNDNELHVASNSPFVNAGIVTALSCYVAAINLIGLDTVADTLLYCTMVDDDARQAADDIIVTKDGLPLERTCPQILLDLLEAAQRMRDAVGAERKMMKMQCDLIEDSRDAVY